MGHSLSRQSLSLLLATAAVAAPLSSCGGSSSTKSLQSIQSCLTAAGYPVAPGIEQQLAIALPAQPGATAITVTIRPSAQDASSFAGDQNAEFGPHGVNKGGGAVSQGKVVVSYARAVPASDLAKVESCAF